MTPNISRRAILRSSGVAGLSIGLAGCSSNLTGSSDSGIDVLNIIAYPEDGTTLFRDYYNVSDGSEDIIVPDGLRDGDLPNQVGADMSNIVGTSPAAGGPNQKAFTTAFEAEYGESPGVFTAQSYDSVAIGILANAAAGTSDPGAIRDQIRNIANPDGQEVGPQNFIEGINAVANGENINYQGASSSTNFDESGDPATAVYSTWEFADDGTRDLEAKTFESDTPEGDGPSADSISGGFGRTIDVGILLPESGNLASVGGPMIQAAELPVIEVNNSDLDLAVNAEVEDTQTDPNAGTAAAEQLVNAGMPFVCGSASSSVNVPVSKQVFIPNEVVGCSPSSTALSVSTLEDDDYIFRTAPSDYLQGAVMADVTANRLEASTAATLYVNNDYGQQLSDRFSDVFNEEFDGTVTDQVAFNPGEDSYTSVIQEALSGG